MVLLVLLPLLLVTAVVLLRVLAADMVQLQQEDMATHQLHHSPQAMEVLQPTLRHPNTTHLHTNLQALIDNRSLDSLKITLI